MPQPTLSGLGQFQDYRVAGGRGWAIQLNGPFVATVTFQGSIDNKNFLSYSHYSNVSVFGPTTTVPGIFVPGFVNNALTTIRVIVSAYTSGAVELFFREVV